MIVWGTIGRKQPPWRQDLGVDNPALFAAEALISVLRDRGIVVRGVARSQYSELSNAPCRGQPMERSWLFTNPFPCGKRFR